MSIEFEAKRNSTDAVVVWLLWIHFDAFFDLPAKDFYFSSTENVDFPVNGVEKTFEGRLMKDLPKGRHQKDRGNDYCEFSFLNVGGSTYQEFLPYENLIERGQVVVFHCLQLEQNYYEGETRFVGYLKDYTISESDKSLKFTAMSDMSRTGFPVGARILTRERCGTEFNFDGLFPPDAKRGCTWQTAQGGNPDFCSKYLKGVDGCVAHGNAHQFFAVTALSTAAIEFVSPNDLDFPYENNPCFTENNFVLDPDWNLVPINFAKVEQFVLARDLFTQEIVRAEILAVRTHIVEEYSIAAFEDGSVLEATKNHLFRIKGSTFAPLGTLRGKEVLGCQKDKKDASNRLTGLVGVQKGRVAVYNLHTTANTYIITDKNAKFYFDVHNWKPALPINL